MKFIALWCALWCISCSRCSSSNQTEAIDELLNLNLVDENGVAFNIAGYLDGWVPQKLDHFNSTDTRLWQQRYHVNSEFYEKGGPVFLILGGQKEIEFGKLVYEHFTITEYAKEFKAYCFILEHRFYGKSRATNDTSVENLKYLTVEQAMADVKNFIFNIRMEYRIPQTSKLVTFGESYSGSLAAWMRMNHPYMVHAAVSSSGMFNIKINYREFNENVKSSLAKYAVLCMNQVTEGARITNTLYSSDVGVDILQKKMKTCQMLNISDKRQRNQFFAVLSFELAYATLQNDFSKFNLKNVCDIMNNNKSELTFERFSEIHQRYLEYRKWNCRDVDITKSINWLKLSSWENVTVSSGSRQRWHQKCTEMGLFVTSSLKSNLFGDNIPVDYFEYMCTETFGNSYNFTNLEKNIEKINKLNVKSTESRIINVQGSLDPWHSAGILKDSDQYFKTVLIEGTSHAEDTVNSKLFKSPKLEEAHQKIKNDLKEWLKSND